MGTDTGSNGKAGAKLIVRVGCGAGDCIGAPLETGEQPKIPPPLVHNLKNHLEEMLLDQAQAWAPPPPFLGEPTLIYDIGCLSRCKIIVLGNTIIPQMIFSIFDHSASLYLGTTFQGIGVGLGVGSKLGWPTATAVR